MNASTARFHVRVLRLSFTLVLAIGACLLSLDARATQITESDAKYAKSVFNAIDKNRFKDALKLTKRVKDPSLVRVLVWKFMTAKNTPAKFEDVEAFLSRHENWPNRKQMLRRAEETMPHSFSPAKVLAWFDQMGGPVSTIGRQRKAEAQLKLGLNDEARAALKRLWVEGNFTKQQETQFYAKHKQFITKQDHLSRLDRLIWEERYWPARRQIWKVDNKYRKWAIARIWLQRREGNVDAAIKNLEKIAPELLNEPGLVYERLRWRRRKGRIDDAAELFAFANGDPRRPDKWWRERAYIARQYLQQDRIEDAYTVITQHGLSPQDAAEFSDAEWTAGWISLQFLNKPEQAYRHFRNMLNAVSYPISLARGNYWSGRAATALGQDSAARAYFNDAARHSTTYYGQLARAKIGMRISFNSPPPVPTRAEQDAFNAHPLKQASEMLASIQLQDRLRGIVLGLANAKDTPGWKRLSADLAFKVGRPDLAVTIAKRAERADMPLGRLGYPMIEMPKPKTGEQVETPLVLAVIRQESAFYTTAKSHAGARGLMQVMPATAKRVAHANRIPYSRTKLLQDPNYNLVIGQIYLANMIEEFEGSFPMALAAYNAGPHRVGRWLKSHGDPRKGEANLIDWIEMIPYKETRNYVQRVLENLNVYRAHIDVKNVAEN